MAGPREGSRQMMDRGGGGSERGLWGLERRTHTLSVLFERRLDTTEWSSFIAHASANKSQFRGWFVAALLVPHNLWTPLLQRGPRLHVALGDIMADDTTTTIFVGGWAC